MDSEVAKAFRILRRCNIEIFVVSHIYAFGRESDSSSLVFLTRESAIGYIKDFFNKLLLEWGDGDGSSYSDRYISVLSDSIAKISNGDAQKAIENYSSFSPETPIFLQKVKLEI